MYPYHLHNERRFPREVIAIPREDRQIVEVILLKDELLHDIETGIQQVERLRTPDQPRLLAAGGEDSYMLQRHIDTAVNQAVARCQAYLFMPSPFVHRVSADHVHGWQEKSIYLAMPQRWPAHTIDTLRDAVHNYIVYRAMQLFLALSDEKAAAVCDAQAVECYDDIRAIINTRIGPTNIHPTFLG